MQLSTFSAINFFDGFLGSHFLDFNSINRTSGNDRIVALVNSVNSMHTCCELQLN